MRPVRWKPPSDIESEWNAIAAVRRDQIREGRDLSYLHVLKPCVLKLCTGMNTECVLDIGCGVGSLAIELAGMSSEVVGIDISSESLRLARETAGPRRNVRFERLAAEALATRFSPGYFSSAIANMSFSVIRDLDVAIKGIASVLRPDGRLIITVPHPWFWPVYAGFQGAEWFRYTEEILIEWEFRISLERTGCLTTFIHRSLERYCSALRSSGFAIEVVTEPMPDADIEKLYPSRWTSPRFLGMRCRKL